jgi:hypothetical protein
MDPQDWMLYWPHMYVILASLVPGNSPAAAGGGDIWRRVAKVATGPRGFATHDLETCMLCGGWQVLG